MSVLGQFMKRRWTSTSGPNKLWNKSTLTILSGFSWIRTYDKVFSIGLLKPRQLIGLSAMWRQRSVLLALYCIETADAYFYSFSLTGTIRKTRQQECGVPEGGCGWGWGGFWVLLRRWCVCACVRFCYLHRKFVFLFLFVLVYSLPPLVSLPLSPQEVAKHCDIKCMPTFHFYRNEEKVSLDSCSGQFGNFVTVYYKIPRNHVGKEMSNQIILYL